MAAAAALLTLAGLGPARAAGPTADPATGGLNPDWPCVQRLVPELSAAMMWSGPPLEGADGAWRKDPERAALVQKLSDRSVPLDQAEGAIDAFARDLAPERRAQELTSLFQGVFQLITEQRHDVIEGIERYAKRQRLLAQKITGSNRQLDALRQSDAPDAQSKLQERQVERDWDARIYDERRHALSQVCDQPVQLERRAFAIARAVQGRLE
ncbi:MAG: hypothetical protein ACREH6_05785 [Geminicoccaceae bacterium]